MSDVIVSTTESTTDVATTNDVTTVAITDTTVEVSQSTAGFQGVPGSNSDPTYVFVTNKTGSTLAKGSIVYVSGANGVHTQVSLALATGDVTSARTLGWLAEDIANNATGLCMVEGYLDGVNTQGVTEGAQLYLSTTVAGGFQETKPQAPDHLVYVGVCAKASSGNGRVFVKVQNGYELDELHDVQIISKANKDLLQYDSATNLWKNVASTAITAGSAITSGTAYYASLAGTATTISGSITKSQVSDFTSGTVTSASTAQQAGTAFFASTASTADYATTAGTSVYSANSGTASYATAALSATSSNSAYTALLAGTAVFAANASTATYALSAGTATAFTGSISRIQVTDFASGTVASADYATTSGTAVSISGTITRSQVSDFASGTVANISGTVTQAQVANLTTDLAGKANLVGGNSLSGAQTITASTATQIPLTVISASGQSVNLQEWDNSSGVPIAVLSQSGGFTSGGTARVGQIVSIPASPATVGLVVRGASSQSANYLEIQDSTGSTAVAVNSLGTLLFGTGLQSFLSSNGRILAVASTATIVPMTVRGASGQTSDLQQWQNSGSTVIAKVDKNGAVSANYFGPSGAGLLGYVDWTTNSPIFNTGGTGVVGLVVKGVANQSANLLEIQNSGGTAVALVNPFGAASFGTNSILGRLTVSTGSSGTIGQIIRGAASQSANLQEWQNSSGGTVANIDAFGNAGFGGTAASSSFGLRVATNNNPAVIGILVRGAASQSADLQQWQNSSGGTVTAIDSTGQVMAYNGIRSNSIVNTTTFNNSRIQISNTGTIIDTGIFTNPALRVQNTNSTATANLTEWLTSTGSTAAYVGSGGAFRAAVLQTSSAAVDARLRNAGGEITFAKATAVSTNPGAGYGKIYFRDGTNAGTLKLVVIAGTAGAETTILDNIPT